MINLESQYSVHVNLSFDFVKTYIESVYDKTN